MEEKWTLEIYLFADKSLKRSGQEKVKAEAICWVCQEVKDMQAFTSDESLDWKESFSYAMGKVWQKQNYEKKLMVISYSVDFCKV